MPQVTWSEDITGPQTQLTLPWNMQVIVAWVGFRFRKRKKYWSWIVVMGFPGGPSGKEPTCQCRRYKGHWLDPCVGEESLQEGMATHSSILAWRIPWTEGPCRLQPIRSHRVHDWRNLSMHAQSELSGVLHMCIPVCTLPKLIGRGVQHLWRLPHTPVQSEPPPRVTTCSLLSFQISLAWF